MNRLISNNILITLGLLLFVLIMCQACRNSDTKPYSDISNHTLIDSTANILEKKQIDYDVEQWKEINSSNGIILDIRYATKDNFTGQVIYDCPRCFLRPEAATIINRIQADINTRYGYSLKIFDCYRPRPAQQKLWDIKPDAKYVTPPKRGSMHNRGQAIDLTLVDSMGIELDMGTPYDFFGPEAHTDVDFPDKEVQTNRDILRKLMILHGFTPIRTEWWHFSLKTIYFPFDDWEWPCN